jgi:hypothetical protein
MTAISSQAIEAQRLAADLMQRDLALGDLVSVLDPGRTQALHGLAGTITRMMQTHATGVQRVLAGGRPPRDEIEAALVVLVRVGCPSSQRRLFDLLTDLFN